MGRKLTSRKLWVAVLGGLALWANAFLPEARRLPPEVLMAIAALAATYVIGEAAVDRARARATKPPSPPKPRD